MKAFTCIDHDGLWPVPVASVVVAETEQEARDLLAKALKDGGLNPTGFTLQEINLTAPNAAILSNGDY